MTYLKYEILWDEKKVLGDTVLYRIRALKDFADVLKGDRGGWVESGANLSQAGDCWIYDEALAFSYGAVMEDAQLRDYSSVYIGALIRGKAIIKDQSFIYNHAIVSGNVVVKSGAIIADRLVLKEGVISGDSKANTDAIKKALNISSQASSQSLLKHR